MLTMKMGISSTACLRCSWSCPSCVNGGGVVGAIILVVSGAGGCSASVAGAGGRSGALEVGAVRVAGSQGRVIRVSAVSVPNSAGAGVTGGE